MLKGILLVNLNISQSYEGEIYFIIKIITIPTIRPLLYTVLLVEFYCSIGTIFFDIDLGFERKIF